MAVDVLLGLQWGDEGKGKIVDYLAPNYSVVARFQGGPNAGHTLVIDNQKTVLHTVPSGIFHQHIKNVIGNGVVIDPYTLKNELSNLEKLGLQPLNNLRLSNKAHLILPTHKILDAASEHAKGKAKIGSTLKGITPTYMDKTGRNGLRVGDVHLPDFKTAYTKLKEKHLNLLKLYNFEFDLDALEEQWWEGIAHLKKITTVDVVYFMQEAIKNEQKILAEGAQGSLLDIDFGTYPFVTSSNTICASACKGLGIPPTAINEVIGISKAYCTRVGAGPFPTELDNDTGELLREKGKEFGATTGRPRRCGWIDLPALKYAIYINGVTQIVLTKADVLNEFETIQVCDAYDMNGQITEQLPFDLTQAKLSPHYESLLGWNADLTHKNFEDLPGALVKYVNFLETKLEVPINLISVGPGRNELIDRTIPALA